MPECKCGYSWKSRIEHITTPLVTMCPNCRRISYKNFENTQEQDQIPITPAPVESKKEVTYAQILAENPSFMEID